MIIPLWKKKVIRKMFVLSWVKIEGKMRLKTAYIIQYKNRIIPNFNKFLSINKGNQSDYINFMGDNH